MKSDLKILLVEDSAAFRQSVSDLLGVYNDVDGVENLHAAREALAHNHYEVVILDKGLPDGNGMELIPTIKAEHPYAVIIMLTADSDFNSAKKCLAAGADDYVVKSENAVADLLVRIPFAVARAAETRQLASLTEQVERAFRFEIVGHSRPTMRLREQILSVRGANSHTLITGESGTGKELIARRLHSLSGNKSRPFVAVNCSAIPLTLIEDELFGHVKGAFTGAIRDRAGQFELAHGGDLFLDEIGDMPLEAQAKLLRVIQDGQIFRVGGSRSIQVNCRIIAATNKPIEEMVSTGTFRQDLYYRLNVVQFQTTPLRDRPEDIPSLASHFLLQLGGPSYTITEAALARLADHSWPGNIREFRNVIERAVLRARYKKVASIDERLLSIDPVPGSVEGETNIRSLLPFEPHEITVDRFDNYMLQAERDFMRASVDAVDGNVLELATRMGMARATAYKKLTDLGIPRNPYRKQSAEVAPTNARGVGAFDAPRLHQ